MLTYGGVDDPMEIILKEVEQHPSLHHTFALRDYTIVFEDGKIILMFNNMPMWPVVVHHSGKLRKSLSERWIKYLNRRIRLGLKLRARRARLRAKAGYHSAPAQQATSEAR
jgi:hypothetical protein